VHDDAPETHLTLKTLRLSGLAQRGKCAWETNVSDEFRGHHPAVSTRQTDWQAWTVRERRDHETTRAKALLVLVLVLVVVLCCLLLLAPTRPRHRPRRDKAHQTVASCPSCGARRRYRPPPACRFPGRSPSVPTSGLGCPRLLFAEPARSTYIYI